MNIHQLETPALVLDADRFEENLTAMQRFADASGIALRPHYKSHKNPWIAHRQLQAGAKGITCATLGEAEDLARAGINDILIANVIPNPVKVSRIAALAGCCRLTVCVDQADNIARLEQAAALFGATVRVLIEYDIGMSRSGVDHPDDFIRLAKQIERCGHLVFDGIQAYAGQLSHEVDYAARENGSDWVEQRLRDLKQQVEAAGLPVREVSGTSTGTVQFRAPGSVYTEMQAGSYIFMDKSYRRLDLNFSNALFLLTEVVSVVGNRRIVVDGGMKSVSCDQTDPVFEMYPDIPVQLSEEHITLPFVPPGVAVGDRFRIIPGHCCTTVNLHDAIYLVRGDTVIDRLAVVSRGKSR